MKIVSRYYQYQDRIDECEITGKYRKLPIDQLYDLFSAPNIVGVMKSWKARRSNV
jgi:hypothetical protein